MDMNNKQITPRASTIENGIEICNTCTRPADSPYRYNTLAGDTRGCISRCHDVHVRSNVNPNWTAPRYVLPKWITVARSAMKAAGMVAA